MTTTWYSLIHKVLVEPDWWLSYDAVLQVKIYARLTCKFYLASFISKKSVETNVHDFSCLINGSSSKPWHGSTLQSTPWHWLMPIEYWSQCTTQHKIFWKLFKNFFKNVRLFVFQGTSHHSETEIWNPGLKLIPNWALNWCRNDETLLFQIGGLVPVLEILEDLATFWCVLFTFFSIRLNLKITVHVLLLLFKEVYWVLFMFK